MNKDLEHFIRTQVCQTITPSLIADEKLHSQYLNCMYRSLFEDIIQYIERQNSGLSLEDMVKQIGEKANRHNHPDDRLLSQCITNMFKMYEDMKQQRSDAGIQQMKQLNSRLTSA